MIFDRPMQVILNLFGRCVPGAQGGVRRRVDFLSGKKRGAPFIEAALGRELDQKAQRERAHALARIVELHARRFGDQLPRASRIARQQFGEPRLAPRVGVRLEFLPGGAVEGRSGVH